MSEEENGLMLQQQVTNVVITCEVDRVKECLYLSDSIEKNIRRHLDTKEDAVRKGLIALGWTPPGDTTENAQMQLIQDYREYETDVKRLTREIDVIINGEEGAAKQASLCDLISQIKNLCELFTLAGTRKIIHENIELKRQVNELTDRLDDNRSEAKE